MNSCSRLVLTTVAALIGIGVLTSGDAEALNVHAIYRTACSRELGVILKVEKREIHLLTLAGEIQKIPRHEIVSLAYYPVSKLPLAKLPARPSVAALRVRTLLDKQVVDLATGWPVDYSETKIAFLLDSGKDIVIEKDSIWSLEFQSSLERSPALPAPDAIDFAHPQTAGFCAAETSTPNARRVFAQQILNDRIVIKRELDRLQLGYEEVIEFEADQKFYPVPHVYRDRTTLGLWVSALSRYGSSKSRSNNYTPILVDELHLGPFRYQHLFLSGAAPNAMFLHNEAQSQLYYRFKAAYFHASVFLDPNLVLVGTKYGWREEDLEDESLDDRLNEWLGIEFGFDYGPFAVELAPAVLGQAAIRTPDLFDEKGDINFWRAGLRFTRRTWEAQLWGGYANTTDSLYYDPTALSGETEWTYLYARANLRLEPAPRFDGRLSVVYRYLDYLVVPWSTTDSFAYQSTSVSTSLQSTYALSHRFAVGANAILEVQLRRAAEQGRHRKRLLPKFGVFTSFSF